jgi:propanediol dehydratase large subunit
LTILILGVVVVGYIIYKEEKRHKIVMEVINGYKVLIDAIESQDYDTINYYIDLYEKSDGIADEYMRDILKNYIKFALNEIEKNKGKQ